MGKYPGGDIDSEDKEFFRRVNWTYIPEPTEEELATAVLKRNNRLLGYFCQSCKSTSVKLLLCKGCEVVHYCDTGPHANGEPTSCSLYMTIELVLEGEAEYKEGGLHYLALDNMDPGMFWGMALNFNTFGTVAPFTTKCHCNFPKMPPSYKKLKKQWDKIFTRAKKSGLDVQCMFADTPIGCHSFGLDGEEGCKFKHDVSVKND